MNFTRFKETLYLRGFGLTQVFLIFVTRPSVVELEDDHCVIKIPLNRITRNHLGSMYFGSLCIGADVAGGIIAMRGIEKKGAKVSLVFKDFKANFLKRPEGDVHFTCRDGEAIQALVEKTVQSGVRENMTVRITATVPSESGDEPVAEFELTLSLKKKSVS